MASSHAAPPAGFDPSLTYSTPPLTGDDIKEMLELRASKHRVDFDKPKNVKVVIEVLDQGEPTEIELPGPCKYVTVMLYQPDKERESGLTKMYYWLDTERGGHHSSFHFDASRATHSRSGILDGTLTIKASYNSQFTDKPTYQIKVIAKDA
ncbi:hypothetical protein [Roseimicrobium sp. ORNL1]|uniref:hypothetical protein n=1 Tax=Roseimicrobium sp. ORNL1 TaxID=2711231 RepID=UPI0013E17403|nr:hypothetical protein [Roseimicrobium sp. ORNL1]QIF05144.1 hypothetical protein G5S37_27730 [Roseimicrobium sp. ORNL1]